MKKPNFKHLIRPHYFNSVSFINVFIDFAIAVSIVIGGSAVMAFGNINLGIFFSFFALITIVFYKIESLPSIYFLNFVLPNKSFNSSKTIIVQNKNIGCTLIIQPRYKKQIA